jgi:hypothetical protein
MKTWEVTVCVKATLTVRVEASSEPDAEDLAHELANGAIERMTDRHGVVRAKEDDRAIHRVTEVKPVRTVPGHRDIGDGVIADDWSDQ